MENSKLGETPNVEMKAPNVETKAPEGPLTFANDAKTEVC